MNIREMQNFFAASYPGNQPIIALAPGRVNLLGEHTDYNDGFVLPMAIDAKVAALGAKRDDMEVVVYSFDYQVEDGFSLTDITLSEQKPWSNYVRGVCQVLLNRGYSLRGANIVFQGDVPQGAGLSSSAALEVAIGTLLNALYNLQIAPVDLVKIAQKAENDFVGVKCGIMDQFISGLGKQDHALFLDCRSLDYKLVPLKLRDYKVVVIDSGVKRGLVDSEYNARRKQCEQAVEHLQKQKPGIINLRDVTLCDLPAIQDLPELLSKRARHVVTENERVKQAMRHLEMGQLDSFGQLMIESHRSLRDDYEVSCPELDLLVELALAEPGCIGSRMTGAGFGGCTVSLVEENKLEKFSETVTRLYKERTGIDPRLFVFTAGAGAHTILEE